MAAAPGVWLNFQVMLIPGELPSFYDLRGCHTATKIVFSSEMNSSLAGRKYQAIPASCVRILRTPSSSSEANTGLLYRR